MIRCYIEGFLVWKTEKAKKCTKKDDDIDVYITVLFFFKAICNQGCKNKGRCVRPNVCSCSYGWTGSTCSEGKLEKNELELPWFCFSAVANFPIDYSTMLFWEWVFYSSWLVNKTWTIFAQLYSYLIWNQVLINPDAIESKKENKAKDKKYY